jgi:hypothetical protein
MEPPALHDPTPAGVAEVVRRCGLPPSAAETIEERLTRLVHEIRADQPLSDAERRKRRRERLAVLDALAKALNRSAYAIKTTGPGGAEALREVLGATLGRFLSSEAFGTLLGLPVHPSLGMRERESREATSRAGPYGLLEAKASFERQALAQRHGDRLAAAFFRELATAATAELEAERLNAGGRPADRSRRIALVRVLQLHKRLTGRPATSQPSQAYIDLAERCFEAIGLPTPKDGLALAASRLFDLASGRRRAPT